MSNILLCSNNHLGTSKIGVFSIDPTAMTEPILIREIQISLKFTIRAATSIDAGSIYVLASNSETSNTELLICELAEDFSIVSESLASSVDDSFAQNNARMLWDDARGNLWISAWNQSVGSMLCWVPSTGLLHTIDVGPVTYFPNLAIGPDGSCVRSSQFKDIVSVKRTGSAFSVVNLTTNKAYNWTACFVFENDIYLAAYDSPSTAMKIHWNGESYESATAINFGLSSYESLTGLAVSGNHFLVGDYYGGYYAPFPTATPTSVMGPVPGAPSTALAQFWRLSDCAVGMGIGGQVICSVSNITQKYSENASGSVLSNGNSFYSTVSELLSLPLPPPQIYGTDFDGFERNTSVRIERNIRWVDSVGGGVQGIPTMGASLDTWQISASLRVSQARAAAIEAAVGPYIGQVAPSLVLHHRMGENSFPGLVPSTIAESGDIYVNPCIQGAGLRSNGRVAVVTDLFDYGLDYDLTACPTGGDANYSTTTITTAPAWLAGKFAQHSIVDTSNELRAIKSDGYFNPLLYSAKHGRRFDYTIHLDLLSQAQADQLVAYFRGVRHQAYTVYLEFGTEGFASKAAHFRELSFQRNGIHWDGELQITLARS